MNPPSCFDAGGHSSDREVLWQDNERIVRRAWGYDPDRGRHAILVAIPAVERPAPSVVNRLTHEYGLKHELDGGWAVRPLDLAREHGRTILVLESPEGEPLDRLIGPPMEAGRRMEVTHDRVRQSEKRLSS